VARDCFQLYLDEKLKLKAFFKSDCRNVALTTYCWEIGVLHVVGVI